MNMLVPTPVRGVRCVSERAHKSKHTVSRASVAELSEPSLTAIGVDSVVSEVL
jgi:hypothetical protein